MPDTPNYDYLKPVLGEELFGQFAEKMAAAQGIQLANGRWSVHPQGQV